MKKQLRDAWVTALRSGEYKQCRGELSNGFGAHCVNGVLCHITGISMDFNGYNGRSDAYKSLENQLPLEYRLKVQELNDWNHMSFSEIADYIENNIPVED